MESPAIANYSDRHGRQWLISAGLALYTAVSVCYIFAGSVLELFVIRLVHGITIPPLIFGVILVACGVDAIFIISGLLALAALVPFQLLVVRSRKRPGGS